MNDKTMTIPSEEAGSLIEKIDGLQRENDELRATLSLMENQDSAGWFGCTKIQRHFHLGYNDARRLVDHFIIQGMVEESEYSVKFKLPINPKLAQDQIRESEKIEKIADEKPDATGRTPKDYAIEHAEYMARNAEYFLKIFNECITEDTEFCNDDDSGRIGEAARDLRSGIYEFRKRATRVS